MLLKPTSGFMDGVTPSYLFWGHKVKVQGYESQQVRVGFIQNAILPLVACKSHAGFPVHAVLVTPGFPCVTSRGRCCCRPPVFPCIECFV